MYFVSIINLHSFDWERQLAGKANKTWNELILGTWKRSSSARVQQGSQPLPGELQVPSDDDGGPAQWHHTP